MAISLFKKGRKKYTITVIVLIIIILLVIIHSKSSSSSTFQTAVVSVGNVSEIVSVTGQVIPVGKADLSFEKSGVLSTLNVKVGDSVTKGAVLASLDSATDRASLASAQAKLDDMTRTLRPEESAVDQAKVTSAQVGLTNALRDAINASSQGYVSAQTSINNYTDIFFTNPQSANPTINVQTQSLSTQASINSERLGVSGELSAWKSENDSLTTSISSTTAASAGDILSRSSAHITVIKNFIADLALIINNLNPSSSGMNQNTINSYVSAVNSALSGINSASTAVTSAQTELANASSALASAQSQFTLDNAGSSADAIAAQSAQVALYQAQLNQDSIISPIDGTVSRADPTVGEFVQAGQVTFGVINNTLYKIEAYVPEADIAKVAINNTASVTLDAYGSDVIFPAHVTDVDPAETVLQGVPTYKVTLYFNQPDSRIRSGMTANTDIHTHEVDNTLEIPYRAVIDTNGAKSVRLLNANGTTFATTTVTTGLRGSEGTIQILSGLTAGQSVVTDVKK